MTVQDRKVRRFCYKYGFCSSMLHGKSDSSNVEENVQNALCV